MNSVFDLERLAAETFVATVEYRDETASTSDLALQLIRDRAYDLPLLVLAASQTGGRGRGAKCWWSGDGALTFTLVLDAARATPPDGILPQVSLVAGLAVCEVLDGLHPVGEVRLKWPNDVLVGRRKICGVLAEAPARPRDHLVLGIGINVNNSLAEAPDEVRWQAASLIDATGHAFDLSEVLILILRRLGQQLQAFARGSLQLRTACAPWSALTGRFVCLRAGRHRVAGVCEGIDDDGAIVIRTEQRHHCLSGVIESIDWGD